MIWDVHPGSGFFSIPDSGVKSTGSATLLLTNSWLRPVPCPWLRVTAPHSSLSPRARLPWARPFLFIYILKEGRIMNLLLRGRWALRPAPWGPLSWRQWSELSHRRRAPVLRRYRWRRRHEERSLWCQTLPGLQQKNRLALKQFCGSGSGTNNPDHISESLEIFFWLNYLNTLRRIRIRDPESFDPGSGMENIRIRDHPQHCL